MSGYPEHGEKTPRWISVAIPASAGFFIFVLFIAALFEPSIRVLHFFQALIYVAIIFLTRRNSAWGFGAGCLIAAFWNYLFLRIAAVDIWALLTARAFRADIALQFAATIAHFVLIIACVAGFLRLKPNGKQWTRFLAGGIAAVGYLLLLIVTMRSETIPLLKKCFGM